MDFSMQVNQDLLVKEHLPRTKDSSERLERLES